VQQTECAGFWRLSTESVKRYGFAGRFVGLVRQEQIVYVLLNQMTAVHGVLRELSLETLANPAVILWQPITGQTRKLTKMFRAVRPGPPV
jgi:hypothetical protein